VKKTSTDVLFTWQKPESGHEWKQKGNRRDAQYLVPVLGPKGKVTEYVPHPGLFRTFAGLNTAKDEVREREIRVFARAYGDIIARPQDDHVRLTTVVETVRTHATMKTWSRAIQHMRRAVELWDLINAPERHKELSGLIIRNKGAITYRRVHHPLERKEGNDSFVVIATGKKLAEYPVEDLIKPGRKALQYEVQEALTDIETPSHTTPCLLMPDLRLVLRPVNLLADMSLSFARVVSGEIEERPCEMFESCHEYIYVGSGPWLQRDDTTTCSAACRQKKKRQDAKNSAHLKAHALRFCGSL